MNLIFSKFTRSCNCKCRTKAKHLRMKLVKTLPDSTVHFAVKFLSATLSSSWTPFLPVWLPLFSPVLPAEINTVHYLENQKMQSWCSQTSTGVCVCVGVGGVWGGDGGRTLGEEQDTISIFLCDILSSYFFLSKICHSIFQQMPFGWGCVNFCALRNNPLQIWVCSTDKEQHYSYVYEWGMTRTKSLKLKPLRKNHPNNNHSKRNCFKVQWQWL